MFQRQSFVRNRTIKKPPASASGSRCLLESSRGLAVPSREELHAALDKIKAMVWEPKTTLPAVKRKVAIVLKDVAR